MAQNILIVWYGNDLVALDCKDLIISFDLNDDLFQRFQQIRIHFLFHLQLEGLLLCTPPQAFCIGSFIGQQEQGVLYIYPV